jgi:hypothetical protein
MQTLIPPDVRARLVARATTDPAFRQRLLADPRSAIASEGGVELPPESRVQVLQETTRSFYLVLPCQEVVDGELSDAELAGVSGGAPLMIGEMTTSVRVVEHK